MLKKSQSTYNEPKTNIKFVDVSPSLSLRLQTEKTKQIKIENKNEKKPAFLKNLFSTSNTQNLIDNLHLSDDYFIPSTSNNK